MTAPPIRAGRRRVALGTAAAALLHAAGCVAPPLGATAQPPGDAPPPVPREFRAAWVATVATIDWPSRPALPVEQQRAEALAILDRAAALGLNALVLQVRPAADAIYPSPLEPWSEFLTGAQGRAPEPAWDPLAFWVEQAHRRALEQHAWYNPYRARHSLARSPLAATHVALREPALVRRYGEQLWLDPGEGGAAAHTLAVVRDVVRRYDIDGVHIDDYFYPYPVTVEGVEQPFPDDTPWALYQAGGGMLSLEDWRRANVDTMVQALYRTVRELKPHVAVGISPFGLGRPDRRPAGISGFSQYDKLYADVERWCEEGWFDYLAPQLYWPIDREAQAFLVLLDYWLGVNPRRRHVWPGLCTSSVRASAGDPAGPRAWPARELLDQVALLRTRPAAGGHIHFSIAALMQDREGLATMLQMGPYAEPALAPATPWLQAPLPTQPALEADAAGVRIDGAAPARWAVWRHAGGRWRFAVQPAAERRVERRDAARIAVAGVARNGVLGPWRSIVLPGS
ncbi:MAG: glycoside hydrolase family 10 protein [Pseudomonadota bacterium]